MDKSYLFFDIECANCFDGIGKMCSLGYVLTDRYFNILDTDDVVMNPECEFDWYLFSDKNNCKLAYSKDYFRAQHNFESYYKPLKKLFEESERRVIGFSTPTDIGYLISACDRYNFPYINFSGYDIAEIIKDKKQSQNKLSLWCQEYKIDTSNLQAHKSQDDAIMTMLLTKAFCQEQNIEIEELLEKSRSFKLSTEKYIEMMELKKHNKEILEKINSLYGKKCRAVLSNRLEGKEFAFGYKIINDVESSLERANLVYKHSGILQKHLKNKGTLIIQDDTEQETIDAIHKKGLKTLTITELLDLTNMENKK